MLWLKKIPDLFGFGWIIEKILTWRINKEIKKLDGQLRKKKTCLLTSTKGVFNERRKDHVQDSR